MKKNFKLVLALVLSIMMVLGSVSALAATTSSGAIDLTGGKKGHTYTLYQVFTGDVDVNEQLVNIQWGADAPDSLKNAYPTAAAAAKAAADNNDARAWAQGLSFTGGTSLDLTEDKDVTFANLHAGYYVILDTNNNTEAVEGDYSSAIVVKVVGTVTGAMKGEGVTSEKKVKDINDTDETVAGELADSADYDIGDDVPFQLSSKAAGNANTYKKYHITFQDKQSDGLDSPKNFTVTVLGQTFEFADVSALSTSITKTTAAGTKITVGAAATDAGKTFAIKVAFENNTAGEYINDEISNAEITVDYTSKLNANAKYGVEGNPNTSYVKYSNNPEDEDDEDEGKTPDDTVIVFTYRSEVDKVDETGADLNGADFTLYKEVKETATAGAQTGAAIKAAFADDVKAKASALEDNKYYIVVGGDRKVGTSAGHNFEFNGIDDGTYVLVETTVPVGYNAWQSQKIVVTATHTSGDAPELTELNATGMSTSINGGTMTRKSGTHTATSGEAYIEIENNSGATLPSTGGIGTTIFYVAGSIMVLAAAILLVTKRRMGAED